MPTPINVTFTRLSALLDETPFGSLPSDSPIQHAQPSSQDTVVFQSTAQPAPNSAKSAKTNAATGCVYTAESPLVKDLLAKVPATMRAAAESSIPRILNQAGADGVSDHRQIAYILATTQHEAVMGETMREGGMGKSADGIDHYFDQYDAGTAKGKMLGNTEAGDGERFKGRGYVQVTGRAHYAYWSHKLELPDETVNGKKTPYFVAHPEELAKPDFAARTMVQGMRDGSFTGVGLSDYIGGKNADYVGARKVVNGLDNAHGIAKIAIGYDSVLRNYKKQLAASCEPPVKTK